MMMPGTADVQYPDLFGVATSETTHTIPTSPTTPAKTSSQPPSPSHRHIDSSPASYISEDVTNTHESPISFQPTMAAQSGYS